MPQYEPTKNDRHKQSKVTELTTQGYRIVSDSPNETVLETSSNGDRGTHVLIFMLFGWWTFGVANLIYAVLADGERVIVRIDPQRFSTSQEGQPQEQETRQQSSQPQESTRHERDDRQRRN